MSHIYKIELGKHNFNQPCLIIPVGTTCKKVSQIILRDQPITESHFQSGNLGHLTNGLIYTAVHILATDRLIAYINWFNFNCFKYGKILSR